MLVRLICESLLMQVYKACLDIIPHKVFTFAKVWIMFAHFELRQHNLTEARKVMGVAIGEWMKGESVRYSKGMLQASARKRNSSALTLTWNFN